MKTEFDIAVYGPGGNGEIKMPIKGKRVILPGWEKYQFFIHHPYVGLNDLNEPMFANGWQISEVTTGRNITYSVNTQKQAIQIALGVLFAKGEAILREMVKS